jgi:hypothetical protein
MSQRKVESMMYIAMMASTEYAGTATIITSDSSKKAYLSLLPLMPKPLNFSENIRIGLIRSNDAATLISRICS